MAAAHLVAPAAGPHQDAALLASGPRSYRRRARVMAVALLRAATASLRRCDRSCRLPAPAAQSKRHPRAKHDHSSERFQLHCRMQAGDAVPAPTGRAPGPALRSGSGARWQHTPGSWAARPCALRGHRSDPLGGGGGACRGMVGGGPHWSAAYHRPDHLEKQQGCCQQLPAAAAHGCKVGWSGPVWLHCTCRGGCSTVAK